jgi:hypothetical protein
MPFRKILSLAIPFTGLACLSVGYAQAGQWLALVAVILPLLAWLFSARWPYRWLPLAGLVLSVSLSGAGLFLGAAPVLMILSATLALAGWDLMLWENDLPADLPAALLSRLAYSHYRALALAVGLGLLAALAGRFLHLQLPFGILIVLILLALFSLERLWHTLGD